MNATESQVDELEKENHGNMVVFILKYMLDFNPSHCCRYKGNITHDVLKKIQLDMLLENSLKGQ